ncbi:MAG: Cysteine desulfurase NifS [Chlamydiae bacterium]|nr:Cysteine desulfurase NifS [Chlamydiota bacterium]
MSRIFLDSNATTELDSRVVEVMLQELEAGPSNPSSIHYFGRAARQRLNNARGTIARCLGVGSGELIFTSSGTEALNLAILGQRPKGHIITSKIDHAAVYKTIEGLGLPVTYLPVGKEGYVRVEDLENAIGPDTCMIVLSGVNSETGVKNPVEEIAAVAQREGIPLVIDAVAWLGKEKFSIPDGVSAMTFSGHKIHGPKGVGLLFLRKGFRIEPLMIGGGQEALRRGGTENLPGIIGLAKAIELLEEELPAAAVKMAALRNQFEQGLQGVIINGTGPRVCNTSSVTFPGIDGEALLIQLDLQGIAASMGSACSAGALEPSKVLLNMGLTRKEAMSTIRFSLSRFTTAEEIQETLELFKSAQILS